MSKEDKSSDKGWKYSGEESDWDMFDRRMRGT